MTTEQPVRPRPMSFRARLAWWLATFVLSLAAAWGLRWVARQDNFLGYWLAAFAFGTLWAESLAAYSALRNRGGRDG